MRRVAIIGGGITGLTAAYALEQHNRNSSEPIEYLLIERAKQLGGKVRTENIDGFRVEAGPDCFVAEKPAVKQLASQLGIQDRILKPNDSSRRSYIYSRGKIHELPEGLLLLLPTKITPFLLSPLISWTGKARMACDAVIPKRKDAGDETLASFVRRRLGKEMLDKIAAPLVGGIHSNNPETMSLQASFPRLLEMEREYGSMVRAMLTARVKTVFTKARGSNSHFLSFKHGMGEITDSLIAGLDKKRMLTDRIVTRLEKLTGNDKTVYKVFFANNHKPLEVDAAVVATASNRASRILERMDRRAADLLHEIPQTSSANLSLAFKSHELARIPDGFGLMIPAIEKRKISALTLSSTKWNNRAPDPRYSLIRVFVGGYRNQELALMDDRDLVALVRKELSDLFRVTAAPAMTAIHRWIEERPQYTLGHLERVRSIEERLSQHKGLFLAGCSYHGIGVGDCVASGAAVSKAVIDFVNGLCGDVASGKNPAD